MAGERGIYGAVERPTMEKGPKLNTGLNSEDRGPHPRQPTVHKLTKSTPAQTAVLKLSPFLQSQTEMSINIQ